MCPHFVIHHHISAKVPTNIKLQDEKLCTYPEVGGSKAVGGRCSGCGGGGGVGKVGIDVSKQVTHHCRHTRTHVFGG